MKVVATMEEFKPVKVERYQDDLKTGERTTSYLNFIDSLAAELPIGNLLNLINEKKCQEFDEYLSKVTNDDIGTFEKFMSKLCKGLDNDLYESLPYWDILMKEMSYHLSKLDMNSVEGLSILKRTISSLNDTSNDVDELLFELNDVLLNRLKMVDRETYKNRITSFMENNINELKMLDKEKMKSELELILPFFGSKWLQKMCRISLIKEQGRNVVATSIVPKNCVLIQHYENYTCYVLEFSKSKFRVKFHDVAFENVGHPRMLFIFNVDAENKIVQMKLVCIKEDADISLDMPVYHYPYSNVFSNGSVCWNGLKEVNMLPLHQVANLFLSTTNNSHLQQSTLQLFQAMENNIFDDDDLFVFQNNVTLKNLL